MSCWGWGGAGCCPRLYSWPADRILFTNHLTAGIYQKFDNLMSKPIVYLHLIESLPAETITVDSISDVS